MEIAYFIIYIFSFSFYIIYYWKLNNKLLKGLENKDVKEFDVFSSIHSLLFMVCTVVIQLFNYVFFYIFMNRYGEDWKYIIPIGVICIILLIFFTITGFKKKRFILNKYKEQYGIELSFYRQLEYISLFRHTYVIVTTILILNILTMIL